MQKSWFVTIWVLVIFGMLLLPSRPAHAFVEFGGQLTQVIGCFDEYIFAKVGAPRPADILWSPYKTITYSYIPPRHAGQWVLGLYYWPGTCIVSTFPIVPVSGYIVYMMGASY